MKKLTGIIPFALALSLGLFLTACPVGDDIGIIKVDAAPDRGFSWPYYLSFRGADASATLLVETNNTGRQSDDIFVHDAHAYLTVLMNRHYAEALGSPYLVPVFPRPSSHPEVYTHALDRNALVTTLPGLERLDLQLIAMIDDAASQLAARGIAIDRRVFMMGFSASGMFANRFTLLHPDRVKAAAVGSPGGWPIAPVETWEGEGLMYPIGICDLSNLISALCDLETLRAVPLFFYLGDEDTNDAIPGGDAPEEAAVRELVFRLFGETPVARWPHAQAIYDASGCYSVFRLYPGVGHEVSAAMEADVIGFFLEYR
jgi:pimeloyl-ACP methyl ester carboxylesterase